VSDAAVTGSIFALGLAFGAGAYSMAIKAARKEINGLGRRVNRIVMSVIHICPAEKREEITALLLIGTEPKKEG
jgi:hypothetical protein